MIKENLNRINESLPKGVTLVAVSKTKPIDAITEAYNAGQRIFGENRVSELKEKQKVLPADIEWHMIGHLQRNKVKMIAPFVSLIHGVDSERLAKEINKEAKKNNRIINVLLQVHIAREQTKFGFNKDELFEFYSSDRFQNLKNIRVMGLMGMATYTKDETQIKGEFKSLKHCFDKMNADFNANLITLSMGMSGDYLLAIEEGSNMVRIGSSIFGLR